MILISEAKGQKSKSLNENCTKKKRGGKKREKRDPRIGFKILNLIMIKFIYPLVH